jgi:hypothetical protein
LEAYRIVGLAQRQREEIAPKHDRVDAQVRGTGPEPFVGALVAMKIGRKKELGQLVSTLRLEELEVYSIRFGVAAVSPQR